MNKNKKHGAIEISSKRSGSETSVVNRRRFLKLAGSVTLGAAAVTTGVGLFPSNSFAATKIGNVGNATLLQMARDIYPHDKIKDKYYQQVVAPLAKESSDNAETLKLIDNGLKQLDKLSVDQHGVAYLKVKRESDRALILKTIENTEFFQKIKGALLMGIYNNPELWPHFGYGGSSWENGGYIDDPAYGKVTWF
ncbi:MAG: twin-arginine translocation signal domain-containing protein [Neptuniibacter sp.]